MTQLERLTEGHRFVDYKTGETTEEISAEELDSYTEPIEGATADLDALREALREQVIENDEYDQYDEDMSGDAAVIVREHLDITRRTASHPGLWHWLALTQLSEFVRFRWGPQHDLEEKFLAAGPDIYSNAIHRLWWMAELTREGDDYSLTRTTLDDQGQQFANRIFDHWFARDEDAVKAVVTVLGDVDLDIVEEVIPTFRYRETLYRIETMTQAEIEGVLEDILRDERAAAAD